jgi:hypothetical protein
LMEEASSNLDKSSLVKMLSGNSLKTEFIVIVKNEV